ncbi:MAG: SCO family protein, partial [Sulfurimonas sp.]
MNKPLKTLSGILLIVLGFGLIAGLAFPALTDAQHAGRTEKHMVLDFPFLKKEKSELVLVYFGYVGCTRVCTPALNDMTSIYHGLREQNLKTLPSIWFVNMTPEMDPLSVQSWAEHFDKHFKSYAPHENELHSMVQLLNLVYSDLGVE